MSGPDHDRDVTDWRTESRWYRGKPGAGWLFAFLAIPLLLALIGGGITAASNRDVELVLPTVAPTATLTAPPAPSGGTTNNTAPAVGFAPFAIERSSNGFTLTGELPDDATKSGLLDSLKQALPGVGIVYDLKVTPGVQPPEFAGLGGLFGTALEIPDFRMKLYGDTITLTGNAPSASLKAAAEAAAAASWPNVKILNDIQVVAASSTAVTPAPAPAPAPAPPAPPPPPAPGPPAGPGLAGDPCATLQADITSLLKTPINFNTNGTGLAADSSQLVAQIASKVKACQGVKVAVIGYTDNTGSDAINVPLSGSRAKAVADALVADGVGAQRVTSRGAGSANPIASNDSPAGRAQNRRVEITVS